MSVSLKQVGAGEGYLPPSDDLTLPWWDATREHRLLLQTCAACRSVQHYPRYVCLGCGSTGHLGWEESSGRGVIDTFTVVHRAARPDLEVPYVVARIRLAEGPVILSNVIDVRPDDVESGALVVLEWRDLSDGRALPVFVVESEDAA
jgi:hypothetical protein